MAQESQGTRAPVFIPGDARRLPFADAELDAAGISFGLNETADPVRVFSELFRVMRPGALLAVIECCRPSGALGKLIVRLQFSPPAALLLREDRQMLHGLREDLERTSPPEALLQAAAEAGFQKLRMRRFLFGGAVMLWGEKPVSPKTDEAISS